MNIRLTSGSDTLELSPQDSSLAALRHEGGNLLNGVQPLFRLKFRSGKKEITIPALDAVVLENA